MRARTLLLCALMLLPLKAAVLISPPEAVKQTFGTGVSVEKRNILLNKRDAAAVSKAAKVKLPTNIYRLYSAQNGAQTVGYGVLITDTVRTKNAAILYLVSPDAKIAAIEVVAFNEPPEFTPSPKWLSQFAGKKAADTLRVGKDIPSISGATMSARTVTDGSRLALAIFAVVEEKMP